VEWRTLETGEFLSRGIQFHEKLGCMVMPLKKVSIENPINWTKDIDPIGITTMNVQNSLIEASLHPEEYFTHIRSKILPAAFKHNIHPAFTAYKTCALVSATWNRD
jgi:hypothetical protein